MQRNGSMSRGGQSGRGKRKSKAKTMEQKRAHAEALFDSLLQKHPQHREKLRRNPEWQRLLERRGKFYVRCQSSSTSGMRQCSRVAVAGMMVCRNHGARNKLAAIKTAKELKQWGLYTGKGMSALKAELEHMESMPQDKYWDLKDEIKIAASVLRKYLSSNDDAAIARRPYTLMYLMDHVLQLKTAHFEMTHSPKVVFTREQVEYLLMKVRMAVLQTVKDPQVLEQVKVELQKCAADLRSEGWK